MFELRNIDGNVHIKADVVGYQFPDNQNDDWCLLSVAVKQGSREFEKTDPALEAKEIVQIYKWFKSLASDSLPEYAMLSFIEPCIEFNYLAFRNNKMRFSIILSHELKPDFNLEQFKKSDSTWNIVFELSLDELGLVLKGLENTIKNYPVRDRS